MPNNMWAQNVQKRNVSVAGAGTVAPAGAASKRYASAVEEKLDKYTAGTGSKGRLFDARGELNASDRKEAIALGERFAADAAALRKAENLYTQQEVDQMMKLAFGSDQDKMRFAAEMIPLIIERLDYEGVGRQMLRTHEVAQGQIISYEYDVFPRAMVIQEDGQTVESVVKADRKFVPEFLVTAQPTISVMETLIRQYDIIDRTHDKTLQDIMMKEDRNTFKLLYQASKQINTQLAIPGQLDKGVMEELQQKVENHRLTCDKFLMHRADYGDLKKGMNAMEFDPVTSREALMSGIISRLWGVNILVNAGIDEPGKDNVALPRGVVFATTAGTYLGAMPIRQELKVMPADRFVHGEYKYGWLYAEVIGQVINNPRAVACGVKTGAVLPNWLQA